MALSHVLMNGTLTSSIGTNFTLMEQGEKTINSGVYVKGLTEGGHDDFYGIIEHI